MKPYEIIQGDCLDVMGGLPEQSVNTIVTSPPYWGLRDYGHDDQLGLESTPEKYTENMVALFREARRVLRDDGTLWLNLGDSYASDFKGTGGPSEKQTSNAGSRYAPKRLTHGLKPKDLVGIPWRVAFALQADGWYLRSDIIWSKPNPMPESVTDRPTKAHEYIFLMSKSQKYYYDADAVKDPSKTVWNSHAGFGGANKKSAGDPLLRTQGHGTHHDDEEKQGRNKRTVWDVATQPYSGAHFATYPQKLIEPCILAGCPKGGVVLDPFNGSGTTGCVALKHDRRYIGIELNPEYIELAHNRISQDVGDLALAMMETT